MERSPCVGHVNLARGFRGGERQTELLIRGLADLGFAQRLVVRKEGGLAPRLTDVPRLEIHVVPWPYLPFNGPLRDCDLIHGHDGKAAGYVAVAGRRHGLPSVLTRRIQAPPGGTSRAAWRRCTAPVAISESVAANLGRAVGRRDVRVIPSAHARFEVDPRAVAALRDRYAGRFLVVYPGQLVAGQKGQETLIEAARRLADAGRPLHVLLLGRGPGEARFRALAGDSPHVEFGGFVDALGSYLAAADALAFPSLHEGLGSVLLDALHAGLPVVASDIPGVREVIRHGIDGILVPPSDPGALATALDRLREDDGLRDRIRSAARERSRAFAPEVMVERYMALYRELRA